MHSHPYIVVGIFLYVLFFPSSIWVVRDSYAQSTSVAPSVNDNNLVVEPVVTDLDAPVSISFLGPNDLLVADRWKGTVERVIDGHLMKEPLLDVNVFNFEESGMVGIEIAENDDGKVYVFLYYTLAKGRDEHFDHEKNIDNRLYRYELVNDKLVNPKLLLELPKGSGWHNGGAIKLGPDGNLYIPTGDLSSGIDPIPNGTLAQNNLNGLRPDLTGGILRMTQDGKPVGGIIGNSYPESLYFAYGIRNSFGIDFDPITGNMWDTENGPTFGDEINLVRAGFNSGWMKVQGIWSVTSEPKIGDFAYRNKGELASDDPSNLVDFNGKGKYSSPEFTWNQTVGPTAILFLNSDKLGKQYENDMFVSDIVHGRIYHFELNEEREGLILSSKLEDKVADSEKETRDLVFGAGFDGISDMEVGPDGYLYVVSYEQGAIYKISPKTVLSKNTNESSIPVDTVLNISIPVQTVLSSNITRNSASNPVLKNISIPAGDNDTILLKENVTNWSTPLQENATYIEGSFRIVHDKSEGGKDMHAGLVWQEGSNKTYYAFIRPGLIVLSDSIEEINCAILDGVNQDNWNKITIINSPEFIYVYHNGLLKIKEPREFNGTDISLVGIRAFNAKAEFVPIKIGHFNQSLSK